MKLGDLFDAADNSFKWLCDITSSYCATMGEIVHNTWYSANNPIRSFSFDFEQYNLKLKGYIIESRLNQHIQTLSRDYALVLTATLYSLIFVITLNIIWRCGRWLCRRKGGDGRMMDEARRWLRQAELDHQSSQNDMNDDIPAYEWVCFKCQQAAEKAIKAALITRNRANLVSRSGHDLIKICQALRDPTLKELVGTLQSIVGLSSRMRYPDVLPHPQVPHDVYSGPEASNAWEMTGQILQHVRLNYIPE